MAGPAARFQAVLSDFDNLIWQASKESHLHTYFSTSMPYCLFLFVFSSAKDLFEYRFLAHNKNQSIIYPNLTLIF